MHPKTSLIFLVVTVITSNCGKDTQSETPRGGTGVGGSTAQFTIVGNDLFVLDDSSLLRFDISNPSEPNQLQSVSWLDGAETVFPYEGHILIGSATGMYAVEVTDRGMLLVSQFAHVRACDPVIAADGIAYITIRNGARCRSDGHFNELITLDLRTIRSPEFIANFPLKNPLGLALKESKLYICDGSDGIKVMDVSNPKDVRLTHHFDSETCDDVIIIDDHMITIDYLTGIRQYRIQGNGRLEILSELSSRKVPTVNRVEL